MAEDQQGDEIGPQMPEQKQEAAKKQSVLEWGAGVLAHRAKDGWESGHVQAFGGQGIHELGAVFGRAWPESIHIDEPGAIFSPLYRDMTSPTGPNIYGHQPDGPSPNDIANDNTVHGVEQSNGDKKGKSL